MAVLEEHLQVVGLRVVFPHHAVPPEDALAVHRGAPALGTAVVAEGGVGGLTRRTVVDAVDARIFIHLVAILIGHAFDGRQSRRMEGDGATCTVFVLHRTVEIRRSDLETGRIADAESALFRAFLGGDEHHAIAATRAVKGCRRGAFQDVEALDVLLVDVVQGRTPVATSAPVGDTAFVRHRHAVDDNKGLVVAQDAVVTTDGDTRRTAVDTIGVDDLHTCGATAQGADDIARSRLGDQVTTDFLSGIT